MSDQRCLRYQVELMETPGLTISPCEVLNPATLLSTPEDSLPSLLSRYLGSLDKSPGGIVRPTLSKSGTWMEAALSWMGKEEPDMQ